MSSSESDKTQSPDCALVEVAVRRMAVRRKIAGERKAGCFVITGKFGKGENRFRKSVLLAGLMPLGSDVEIF